MASQEIKIPPLEPLELRGDRLITDANGVVIAENIGGNGSDGTANAGRIVACVNACAGIATADLQDEQGPLRILARRCGRLEGERAELLEALEEALGYLEDYASEHDEHPPILRGARAAIAKAKGAQS